MTPGVRIVAFIITFLSAAVGLIVTSRRMADDPRWRSVAAYARASGITVLVLFLVGAVVARPPGAPLHSSLGLFRWTLLAVWLSCTIVLALRLLQVTKATQR